MPSKGKQKEEEEMIFGTCDPRFCKVEKVFRKNFSSGWEREGAAIAVYHKGQLVVDLQGGYADKSARVRWTEDTLTVLFSATKAVGALAVGMLVDKGWIKYSDKISSHWPEFSQHGKGDITLECVMAHRAGLAVLDGVITLEQAKDPQLMAKLIEQQKPNWEPNKKSGYHAVTYGWLVDQIVRRVDKKRRSLAQFVKEEITDKHGLDFHLGLSPSLEHSVSRLTAPSALYSLREIVYDPRVLIILTTLHFRTADSMPKRLIRSVPWLELKRHDNTFNSPAVHQLEQVAALGISKAREMGKLFALMLAGHFVSPSLLEQFADPKLPKRGFMSLGEIDVVVGLPVAKQYGFMYERHPRKKGKWLYGHPGYGGTTLMIEPEEELVISYVSNGLKTGMGELTRTYRRLRDSSIDAAMNK